MREIESINEQFYTDQYGIPVMENNEHLPILDQERVQELIDVSRYVEKNEFCVNGTCVQSANIDGEILLFPGVSTTLETIQDEATSTQEPGFEDQVRILFSDQEAFEQFHKQVMTVHIDSTIGIEPGDRIRHLQSIDSLLSRTAELARKNGSGTPEEHEEFGSLLPRLKSVIGDTVERGQKMFMIPQVKES